MDSDLVLALNEITVLMAISSVGIIALIGEMIFLAVRAIVKGN